MNSQIKQLKEANQRLIEVEKRSAATGVEVAVFTRLVRKLHKEIKRLERRSEEHADACVAHARANKDLNEFEDRFGEIEAECTENTIMVHKFCREVDEFCKQADELEELESRLRQLEESDHADGIAVEKRAITVFDVTELDQYERWLRGLWTPRDEDQIRYKEIERQFCRLQEKITLVEIAGDLPIMEEVGAKEKEAIKLPHIKECTKQQQKPKRQAPDEAPIAVDHITKRARATVGSWMDGPRDSLASSVD
ncbi:MAG: hypothetical protein M1836_006315 [Candelina mexicana]|nr:MAG: hypothetical protein M1836_006315 [Candelina mexicana]